MGQIVLQTDGHSDQCPPPALPRHPIAHSYSRLHAAVKESAWVNLLPWQQSKPLLAVLDGNDPHWWQHPVRPVGACLERN